MSSEANENRCLVVLCTNQVTLLLTSRCPQSAFVYENVTYEDQGFGDFTGFYDWLRNSEAKVIGVRYLPADELDFVREALAPLPYVQLDEKLKSIEFYFSKNTGVDEASSDDQDFGDNVLYKSSTGIYAISFHAGAAVDFVNSYRIQHVQEL